MDKSRHGRKRCVNSGQHTRNWAANTQKLLDRVNGQLLLLTGRGELAQSQTGDGDVEVAVNAFAGSRNADPALKQAGYGIVVNTEIESEIEMGSHTDNAKTPRDEKYDI